MVDLHAYQIWWLINKKETFQLLKRIRKRRSQAWREPRPRPFCLDTYLWNFSEFSNCNISLINFYTCKCSMENFVLSVLFSFSYFQCDTFRDHKCCFVITGLDYLWTLIGHYFFFFYYRSSRLRIRTTQVGIAPRMNRQGAGKSTWRSARLCYALAGIIK